MNCDKWVIALLIVVTIIVIIRYNWLFTPEEFSTEECHLILTFNNNTTKTIRISDGFTLLNSESWMLIKSIEFNNTGPVEMTIIDNNNISRNITFLGYTNVTAAKLEEDNIINSNELYTGAMYRGEDNDSIHQGWIKVFKCTSVELHNCRLYG